MKRYLVFAGATYYPAGGWDDFVQAFDSLEEATAFAKEQEARNDWVQVVDAEAVQVNSLFTDT